MQPFSRVIDLLAADARPPARRAAWCLGGLLLSAWLLWLCAAPLPLYEVSLRARLEVEGGPSPVAAPVAGRVGALRLHLGEEVAAGQLLLELEEPDPGAELASLGELERRQARLRQQLAALAIEAAAAGRAFAALQAGNGAALAARAQAQREAAAAGDLAADRARRDAALVAAGLLPA
ncbi:MAG TPA: biotin/lipoyl-binding protein, partial [Thermoanaerobaculia bacterium]|nr:biotin/lipoyl-binding protein [Thermoanaerobaculia bacterium]